jgi:hypothetical protein
MAQSAVLNSRMRRQGIDVMVPDEKGRTVTHDIIFEELCVGKVLAQSKDALVNLIDEAKALGADKGKRWRGSLLPFGCEAVVIAKPGLYLKNRGLRAAAQPIVGNPCSQVHHRHEERIP